MTVPFEGLRILDLSTEIAGPFATRQLADAGAEIVKIESPAGDPLRRMKTSAVLGRSEPLAEGGDGALFQWLNATKKSVALDLDGSAADRETFLRLVESAKRIPAPASSRSRPSGRTDRGPRAPRRTSRCRRNPDPCRGGATRT